jgi:hypothetical protein
MSELFWMNGHLGWRFFTLLIFTGCWVLLSDLVWRSMAVSIGRLAVILSIGWLMGIGLISIAFHVASR